MIDWTLDLLVERSISQIVSARQDLSKIQDAPPLARASGQR